jgi:uncharacterized membrane protein YhaH (DUF805 family)
MLDSRRISSAWKYARQISHDRQIENSPAALLFVLLMGRVIGIQIVLGAIVSVLLVFRIILIVLLSCGTCHCQTANHKKKKGLVFSRHHGHVAAVKMCVMS